jgi:hypothetical protein
MVIIMDKLIAQNIYYLIYVSKSVCFSLSIVYYEEKLIELAYLFFFVIFKKKRSTMKIKSLCCSLTIILGGILANASIAQAQEVIYNSDGTISTWQNGEEIITDSNGTILQIIQQPLPEEYYYYYQPDYVPNYIPNYGNNNDGYDRNHGHHADGRWQQPQSPTATNVYPKNTPNNQNNQNRGNPEPANSSHGNSNNNWHGSGNNGNNTYWQNK